MKDSDRPKSPLSEILSSYFEGKEEYLQNYDLEKAKEEMEKAQNTFDSVLEAEKMIVRVYKELSEKVSS